MKCPCRPFFSHFPFSYGKMLYCWVATAGLLTVTFGGLANVRWCGDGENHRRVGGTLEHAEQAGGFVPLLAAASLHSSTREVSKVKMNRFLT
jgi:hypothetical protein